MLFQWLNEQKRSIPSQPQLHRDETLFGAARAADELLWPGDRRDAKTEKKKFLLLCKCKNESWKRHGVYNQQKIRWKWWSSSLSKVGNDKIGWIGRGSTGSQFSNKWTSIVLFLDARGFWDYITWWVLIMAIGYQILAPKWPDKNRVQCSNGACQTGNCLNEALYLLMVSWLVLKQIWYTDSQMFCSCKRLYLLGPIMTGRVWEERWKV